MLLTGEDSDFDHASRWTRLSPGAAESGVSNSSDQA